MAYKICIANCKGGVGKSTTALNLADQLMLRGKRVLMVDLDSQRNATIVYQAKYTDEATVADIIKSGYTAKDCIQTTEYGDIIPGDPVLKDIDVEIKPNPGMYYYIAKALSEVEDMYDFIIFDTPPKTGLLLGNAFMAANGVIVPVQMENFAVRGLNDLFEEIKQYSAFNDVKVLGILATKYKEHYKMHSAFKTTALPEMAETMGTKIFETIIRESIKCGEAQTFMMRLSDYAPKSTVCQDYSSFTDELLKEVQ